MKKVAIKLLVDRSGSMVSMSGAAQAINSFVKERKAEKDLKQKISLSQFDTAYELVYPFMDIENAPLYLLAPRGGTALNDAIASAVKELDEYKPDKERERFLVIMTDGEENSSKEHTTEGIKKLLDDRREKGWHIIYLGANQDAIKVAADYGIAESSAITYDAAFIGPAMAAASWSITDTARGGTGTFKPMHRAAARGRPVKDDPQA